MSSFWSSERPLHAALPARLGAALAASAALHAAIAVALHGFPAGLPRIGLSQPGVAGTLRVELRKPQAMAAASLPTPAPAASRPSRAHPPGTAAPLPLPGPHYYSTRELDVRPGIMVRVQPEYPATAGGQSGRVVVRLFIAEDGRVERTAILDASPPGLFERAVEQEFSLARFSPGMKDGRAVKVSMTLEVSFDEGPQEAPAEPGL